MSEDIQILTNGKKDSTPYSLNDKSTEILDNTTNDDESSD